MKINKIKTLIAAGLTTLILTGCGRQPNIVPVVELVPVPSENTDRSELSLPPVEQHEDSLKLILNNPNQVTRLNSQEIASKLKIASSGLLMPSESDYPFKPFIWKNQATTALTKAKLLKLTNHQAGTLVETTTTASFFKNVTSYYDGQTAQEKENVKKFRNLVKVLQENLKNIQIFRVGSVETDVYITGTNNSDFVGLSTKLIETR